MGGVPALHFATAARTLGDAAREAGLAVPTFRSPPRLRGARRTIRRYRGGSVVSIWLRDRHYGDVVGDMVDGVLVANRLRGADAERLRAVLRFAVADATHEPEIDLARSGPDPAAPMDEGPTLTPTARVAERQTQAA